MKKIYIDEKDFDLEKIVEENGLPLTINDEIVILPYEEYINNLRIIDPDKAKEIELEMEIYFEKNKENA